MSQENTEENTCLVFFFFFPFGQMEIVQEHN